ncbi:MAG TPA: hypothetical protein VFY10_03110 [Dehalococcoidia bacterium]|nr:hypothetical protein [Dehalococcoidia bacterium]
MKNNQLLEELANAIVAMTALIALLSGIYWLFTGLSPWPTIVIVQAIVMGSGLGVLTLTSPRRRRS